MADVSDLPKLHDIDADYSPQYVKLARILRGKIQGGEYKRGDVLPAADLAREYKVSIRVAYNALAMLAAKPIRNAPRNFHVLPRHVAGAHLTRVNNDASLRTVGAICRRGARTMASSGEDPQSISLVYWHRPEGQLDPR